MSRLPVYVIFAILLSVILFLIFKQSGSVDSSDKVTQLIPIEKALQNKRPSNIRTNVSVSVESCREADKAFQKLTNNQSLKVDGEEAIEKILLELMSQITKEVSTEVHLSCLLHQLPLNSRQTKT